MREFEFKGMKFSTNLMTREAKELVALRTFTDAKKKAYVYRLLNQKEALSPLQETTLMWLAEHKDVGLEEAPLKVPTLVAMVYLPKVNDQLKRPIIRLKGGETILKLSIASQQSKRPGDVWVAVPDGPLLGWIDHIDGTVNVRSTSACELLREAEKDPEGMARLYGRETGQCSFCAKKLTRKVSMDVGYGPICAERFGLPHADQKGDGTNDYR